MSRFQWWRRLRGGYWCYWHFIGWRKVNAERYDETRKDRMNKPDWSFEDYSVVTSTLPAMTVKTPMPTKAERHGRVPPNPRPPAPPKSRVLPPCKRPIPTAPPPPVIPNG